MSALARFTSLDLRPGLRPARASRALSRALSRVLTRARALATTLTTAHATTHAEVDPSGAADARAGALSRLARGRRGRFALRCGLMALCAALLAAGVLGAASGLLASRAAPGAFAGRVPGQAQGQGPGQASGPASAPRWTEIRRPLAIYDLAGTEFSRLPSSYRARRREPDGAREDVMTFGALGDAKPYLQVSLLRAGAASPGGDVSGVVAGGDGTAEDGAADGLADGLARLAGTRGLTATRVRPAAPMETRLGRFEAADLLLWDGGASTPCLGFRGDVGGSLGVGGGALRVAGFACGSPARPMGRAALACAIDRIDLVSAGEDAVLRAVFVAAERRGGAGGGMGGGVSGATCLGGPRLAALGTGGRLGWLDPGGDLPPLRGLFEATVRRR